MKALLVLLLLVSPVLARELGLQAPNKSFDFIDQKNGIGNSCGPAALLNAFGSGSEKWQQAYQKIPGSSDRARIASVIKSWGQAPSKNLPNRNRWERKGGVNFSDLAVMAGEMRKLNWGLSGIDSELFFAAPGPQSAPLLRTAHQRLAKSLKKGLPPILSVRRFVLREGQWQSVHGHFVVLTGIPTKLAKGDSSFPIEFVDSTGARSYRGEIRLSDTTTTSLPCLVLHCPSSAIGKRQIRSGERSALGFSGAIGTW